MRVSGLFRRSDVVKGKMFWQLLDIMSQKSLPFMVLNNHQAKADLPGRQARPACLHSGRGRRPHCHCHSLPSLFPDLLLLVPSFRRPVPCHINLKPRPTPQAQIPRSTIQIRIRIRQRQRSKRLLPLPFHSVHILPAISSESPSHR